MNPDRLEDIKRRKRLAKEKMAKLRSTAEMESEKYGIKISAEDVKARNEAMFRKAQAKQELARKSYRSGEGMESSLKSGSEKPETKSGDNSAKYAAASRMLSDTGLDAKGTENTGAGVAGGAASGALMGASIGGWQGALVGGAVGGISGGLKARAARKQRLAEIEANKFKALGNIELDKADKISRALENLQNSFRQSVLGGQSGLTLF